MIYPPRLHIAATLPWGKFDAYILQQLRVLAQHAHQMIELLKRETVKFIPADLRPQNSPDLSPVDYQLWGMMQDWVYQMSVEDVADLR